MLGSVAGLKNFWLCCGSFFGIVQGAGSGKYLAQWMLHGDSEINRPDPIRGVSACWPTPATWELEVARTTPGPTRGP